MKLGGMIDDAVNQQRPILHEPEHGIPLLVFWRMMLSENRYPILGIMRLLFGPAPLASRGQG